MQTQPTLQEIHNAIHTAQQRAWHNFRQGDAAGVAALYLVDGQLLPAYSPAINGRAAIQAFWQGCVDMGIGAMLRTTNAIDCLTDTVNEVGIYRFLDRQGQVLDVGKYVTIWKLQQGVWQVRCDIWTSDLP